MKQRPQGESPEGGGQIDDIAPLVPEGEYEVAYEYYETSRFGSQGKVIVHFAITQPDDLASTPLCRYYNVELKGGPGRFGTYKARRHCDLVREYQDLISIPKRRDRISFQCLRGKRIIADVRTVTRDRRGTPLEPAQQYSVISRLIRVLVDEELS